MTADIVPFRPATQRQRVRAARAVHEAAEQFHQAVEVVCRDAASYGVSADEVKAWRHMIDTVNERVRGWRVAVEGDP